MIEKIIDWVRNRRIKETKRLCDLDVLLERVMSRMTYKTHFCNDCLQHGNRVQMYVRRSRIFLEARKPIRDDVGFKCPVCNHTKHVGNPMTRGEAEHEIYLRGSPYLLTPSYSPMEQHDKEIQKRIEALGYGWFG